jgi:hypothetical protein
VAAEHKDFGENLVREDTTEEYSFDALAKGLASGTLTRRKALKLMSTTILGAGVLAFSRARLRLRRTLGAQRMVMRAATWSAEATWLEGEIAGVSRRSKAGGAVCARAAGTKIAVVAMTAGAMKSA